MKQRGGQHPVTRELFHGTSADVCDNICKDGFDRSHCGKNGKKKERYYLQFFFQAVNSIAIFNK